MPSPSEPLQLVLAELVELRTRRGNPMFVGRANGMRVMLVHHEERTNARGEKRQIWRLVADRVDGRD